VEGGVVVLCLDDVGEQHDGASVRVVQLERRGVALLALLGEDVEQPDERDDRHERGRLVDSLQREHEPDRREDRVDAVGPEHRPHLLRVLREAVLGQRPRGADEDLAGKREQVDPG
jgi:hypothetical protein